MCGRFSLAKPGPKLAAQLGLAALDPGPPRYNIAPTQPVLAVRMVAGERHPAWFRWGLIPWGAKDLSGGARMINARSESVFDKGVFKTAVTRRRCLIPADGFFEWQEIAPKKKQPYQIKLKSGAPFVMAGIWDRWRSPEGEEIESCSILTTDANALVAELHDRMPLILPEEAYALWLDEKVRAREPLESLMLPFPAEQMIAVPVNPRVGDPKNDDPSVIEVVEPMVPEPPKGKKAQIGFDFS